MNKRTRERIQEVMRDIYEAAISVGFPPTEDERQEYVLRDIQRRFRRSGTDKAELLLLFLDVKYYDIKGDVKLDIGLVRDQIRDIMYRYVHEVITTSEPYAAEFPIGIPFFTEISRDYSTTETLHEDYADKYIDELEEVLPSGFDPRESYTGRQPRWRKLLLYKSVENTPGVDVYVVGTELENYADDELRGWHDLIAERYPQLPSDLIDVWLIEFHFIDKDLEFALSPYK